MRAVGIILAGGKNERLGDLTLSRATSAMPIGSSYRAIDFTLSNMTNSGVNKVAVITQYNSRSLNDHLSSARWWDFGSKQGGLFVFTPFLSNDNSFWFRGTADSIYQNISFLKRSNEPLVIIASGDGVYKIDYNKLLDFHVDNEADITIMCKNMGDEDVRDYGVIQMGSDHVITEFDEKPDEPKSADVSMGVYVIGRTKLIELLQSLIAEDRFDFVKDVIVRYRKKLKIVGYQHKGYWSSANNLHSYYNMNMDFLKKSVRQELVLSEPHIETKPKDQPPAKYNHEAEVKNVLVGSGSIINGYVEDSVLFRRVFVGEKTSIKNSIVMEGCFIGNNCTISYAILDKEVVLSDGKSLIGSKDKVLIVKKSSII